MIVLDLPLLLMMVGSDLVAGYRLGDTEGDSSQPLPETLPFRADAPQQPVRHHQQTCIYEFTNQCGTCTDNHLSICTLILNSPLLFVSADSFKFHVCNLLSLATAP